MEPIPRDGEIPQDGLAKLSQFIPAVIPVSKATWWNWVKAGKAPQPLKLVPNSAATFWRWSEINAFIEKRRS